MGERIGIVLLRQELQKVIRGVDKPSPEHQRIKEAQIEKDLMRRLDAVIKNNTDLEETIEKHKKQLVFHKKKEMDLKIECSKLEDEILLLNNELLETKDKVKDFNFKLASKVFKMNNIEWFRKIC